MQHIGEEVMEVEKSAEVLACLTERSILHDVTSDTAHIATALSREIAKILLESCQPKKRLPRPATVEDVF